MRFLKISSLAIAFMLIFGAEVRAVKVTRNNLEIVTGSGERIATVLHGGREGNVITTVDGCALARDADGRWCYAFFDSSGRRYSSGIEAGDPDAPESVIRESRNIPWGAVRRRSAALHPSPGRYSFAQERNLIQRILDRHPATKGVTPAVKHGLIILAEFADVPFTHTREEFDAIINGSSSSTAAQYFNDQFGNLLEFRFTVSDIVPLPKKVAYYGGNNKDNEDTNPREMIRDACIAADPGLDFSLFDDDDDGYIDNVFVIFSGKGEEDDYVNNADCIWSHAWDLRSDPPVETEPLDGKMPGRYACAPELSLSRSTLKYRMASIGTFCHEYTHTFGLPDFYDTDYADSGGEAEALWGSLALMDSGNQNNEGRTPPFLNALERHELGIGNPMPLTTGSLLLEPVHLHGSYYLMETDTPGEFYIFECRKETLWDRYIGGSGLLIYHIDQSRRYCGDSDKYGTTLTALERWDIYNQVNCRPDHQCADLVEAFSGAGSVEQVFFPYLKYDAYTRETDPPFIFWSGKGSSLVLTSIRKEGDGIRLSVAAVGDDTPPDAVIVAKDVHQDAAIIQWKSSDASYRGPSIIRWGPSGKEMQEVEAEAYGQGKYSYTIEGLSPTTAYTVETVFRKDGVDGKSAVDHFTTKSRYSDYPFIYLSNTMKNADGTLSKGMLLPLRVYNCPEGGQVSWYLDGKPVQVSPDGYYHVEKAGVLKAVTTLPDGGKDIVERKIILR
jgi:M6 family metalloprotease-like protein